MFVHSNVFIARGIIMKLLQGEINYLNQYSCRKEILLERNSKKQDLGDGEILLECRPLITKQLLYSVNSDKLPINLYLKHLKVLTYGIEANPWVS